MQVNKKIIKHYITKDQNIKGLYHSIKNRAGKVGRYKNIKLLINWDDFYNFVSKNKQYNKIYKEWKDHEFWFPLSPSVDRIDNNGNYSLDNIQILSLKQNATKGNRNNNVNGIKKEIDLKLHLKDKRNEIILLLKEQGYSNVQIANLFGTNRSTIKRITDKSVKLEEDKRWNVIKD